MRQKYQNFEKVSGWEAQTNDEEQDKKTKPQCCQKQHYIDVIRQKNADQYCLSERLHVPVFHETATVQAAGAHHTGIRQQTSGDSVRDTVKLNGQSNMRVFQSAEHVMFHEVDGRAADFRETVVLF